MNKISSINHKNISEWIAKGLPVYVYITLYENAYITLYKKSYDSYIDFKHGSPRFKNTDFVGNCEINYQRNYYVTYIEITIRIN